MTMCTSSDTPLTTPPTTPLAPLLIASSDAWQAAVQGAVQDLGGAEIAACGPRDAIQRLARISPHYTHVLVNDADADGLFNELAALATENLEPNTAMLALGGSSLPHVRVIRCPTTTSVRDALTPPAQSPARDAIDPAELQAPLDGRLIETRYQPIIRLKDRQPIGLEALARMNHPSRGTMLPGRFVPQIEMAGLAADLTRIVTARAFADLQGPFLAHSGLLMAVNVPLDVLCDSAALDRLQAQRQAFDVPAAQIIVELTESRAVRDVEALGRSVRRLRDCGYGVAIDDASPQMPNLDAIMALPFTCMKFGREVIRLIGDDRAMRDFVSDRTRQAHQRGMMVIAEGVETAETCQQVRSLGVDAVQGFLAARPLPVAAVPIWWDSWMASPPQA